MEKIITVNILEELKGIISTLQTYQWKEMASFAFIVNHEESDGRLYLFNSQ